MGKGREWGVYFKLQYKDMWALISCHRGQRKKIIIGLVIQPKVAFYTKGMGPIFGFIGFRSHFCRLMLQICLSTQNAAPCCILPCLYFNSLVLKNKVYQRAQFYFLNKPPPSIYVQMSTLWLQWWEGRWVAGINFWATVGSARVTLWSPDPVRVVVPRGSRWS